jgi:phosphoglycolate phosphatase
MNAPPPRAAPSLDDRLRLVVFDVDGTLVDSQHTIIAAMAEACRAAGVPVPDPAQTRAVIGLSLGEAVARLTPGLGAAERGRVTALYKAAFSGLRGQAGHDEPLFPGVLETLDALEAAGCVLGLATGKSRRGVAALLDRHGLHGRFVTMQTADDGPGKPHPAMLLGAMAQAGVEVGDTVMVGDTTFDMEMAGAARVAALGVAWGNHAPAALTAAGARAVLSALPALPGHLPWAARV